MLKRGKIIKMSNQCLNCGYAVTEPICASCAINNVKVWLYGQKIEKSIMKEINNELKSLLNDAESRDYVILPSRNIWKISVMKCVKCNSDMSLMCFYCVTNQTSQIVKNNLISKYSIDNFNECFHTQKLISN